jgi:hypothetical protein
MPEDSPDMEKWPAVAEDEISEAELEKWREYNRQWQWARKGGMRKGTRWNAAPKVLMLIGFSMAMWPIIDMDGFLLVSRQVKQQFGVDLLLVELFVVLVAVFLAALYDMARSSNRLQDIWQRRP